jgi:hypothetical protein
MKVLYMTVVLAGSFAVPFVALAESPPVIGAPNAAIVATFHAEGAQLYQCSLDADRKLEWRFREPIAALISDGTTVGRHYAGPTWEHRDGSTVKAKVVGSAPGATPDDIPSLRLDVVSQLGDGVLYGVTGVQRINTRGGVAAGPCPEAGVYRSVPYSADYVFFRED